MGWAKYKEDDDEIILERLEEKFPIPQKVNKILYYCPYCHNGFDSKDDMFNHIKNKHGHYGAIVILNNKIALKDNYISLVDSISIRRYDLDLNILINNQELNLDKNEVEINITDLITDYLSKSDNVKITIGDKIWKINKIAKSNINNDEINKIAYRWSLETSRDIHISKDYGKDFNAVEKRCLDGLFNYFIACVSNEHDKVKRYSEAQAILYDFVDLIPIARFIVKIIDIKINWISSLGNLCKNKDYLYYVYLFLSNKKIDKIELDNDGIQIYVEDSIEEIISIIINFVEKKYDVVNDYLDKYTNDKLMIMEDVNLRDKIYLLKARMFLLNNDVHRAKRAYDEIQSPFFEEGEKKAFMVKYY